MKREIKAAENYRQTVFITEVADSTFVSCWMGNRLGTTKTLDQALFKSQMFMRSKWHVNPTIVSIDAKGNRKVLS